MPLKSLTWEKGQEWEDELEERLTNTERRKGS